MGSEVKVKHTPGPWKANHLAIYAGRELVSHVGGTLGAGRRLDEQLANARLIAVAPEMFDLWQRFLTDFASGIDDMEQIAMEAEALIAKVEGN